MPTPNEKDLVRIDLTKTQQEQIRRMTGRDGLAAARNFFFQPDNTAFQLVRGQGGNIFPQHDIGQLLARFVRLHGSTLTLSRCFRSVGYDVSVCPPSH